MKERRALIDHKHCDLSVRMQCRLLGINRSGLYYTPCKVSEEDEHIMRKIDEQYTRAPFYGVEKMTAHLHLLGIRIGHNKVRRLMRNLGLEAVYPKPGSVTVQSTRTPLPSTAVAVAKVPPVGGASMFT